MFWTKIAAHDWELISGKTDRPLAKLYYLPYTNEYAATVLHQTETGPRAMYTDYYTDIDEVKEWCESKVKEINGNEDDK